MIPRAGTALFVALGSAWLAANWPLLTYTVTLALFGLPHVLAELRYVDERFGSRIRGRLLISLLCLLLAIVMLRIAGLGGVGEPTTRLGSELALAIGLAVVTLPILARGNALALVLGSVVIVAATIGALRAPIDTLVVFAVLHNLTPLGFLAERLRGAERRRALMLGTVVFLALPLLVLSGLLSGPTFGLPTDQAPFGWAPLERHFGVFVPPAVQDQETALGLFRMAAYLQCMHYAVVLHLLPRLGGGQAGDPQLIWPGPTTFRRLLMAAGTVMTIGFVLSFDRARAVYGVFAAFHAWLELPVLLLALVLVLPRRAKESCSPT